MYQRLYRRGLPIHGGGKRRGKGRGKEEGEGKRWREKVEGEGGGEGGGERWREKEEVGERRRGLRERIGEGGKRRRKGKRGKEGHRHIRKNPLSLLCAPHS